MGMAVALLLKGHICVSLGPRDLICPPLALDSGPALCKSVTLDLDFKLKLWISQEQLLSLPRGPAEKFPLPSLGHEWGVLVHPFPGGGSQGLMGLNPSALSQCLESSSLGGPGAMDQKFSVEQ